MDKLENERVVVFGLSIFSGIYSVFSPKKKTS